MEQRILLFAFLIAAAIHGNAQNGSPYWSLSGNSNATTASKLGTANATPLSLATNNVTRLYIGTDGKLGFGTTVPASQFHVEGASLNLFVSPAAVSTTSGSGLVGYVRATPTASGQRLGYFLTGSLNGGVDAGNATGMVGYADGAWTTQSRPSYLTFETTNFNSRDRTEAMRIASNGSVGIGTKFPVALLDVESPGGNAIYASSVSGYGVYGVTTFSQGDAIHGYASGINGWGGDFYSIQSNGIYATTGNSGSYAGYFAGSVFSSGNYQGSDKRLKKNIAEFSDAVSIIKKLKPRTYEFLTEGKMAEMNLPKGKHYGLIAQDLETVLPELVKETQQSSYRSDDKKSSGAADKSTAFATPQTFKAVNYTELIPILIKGMQEQDEKMETQDQEIQTLKATVQELKSMLLANNTNGGFSSATLDVASPNPAKGATTIHYTTPANTVSAKLIVVNMSGQVLKEFNLAGGAGQVNLNVSNLASGSYPCTLWLNGQPSISKQLLVAH